MTSTDVVNFLSILTTFFILNLKHDNLASTLSDYKEFSIH